MMSSPRTETQQTFAIKPRTTIRGHSGDVWNAVHLPGGRRIITCSEDDSLRLWDLESGAQIGEDWRDVGGKAGVITIALSPNGKAVASGGRDGKVRLWDVERREVIAKWTGHTDAVNSVCWSADGERVLSASYDRTVRVWDVEIGKTVLGPILMKTADGGVYAARYSHDTTKIAVGGLEEDVKIWDGKTGKLLSTIEHKGVVWSLTWTSDDKKLITGSHNGLIRIYDTDTWQQIATLAGHDGGVFSLYHYNRLLVSTSFDRTARLWNLNTNLPVGPPLQHEDRVNGAAISADGKLLATGCQDKNAYIWDIHTILENAGLEDILSSPDVSLNASTNILSAH
jgi:WD40 repeat protein